jgi:hypothetical protein
MTVTALERSFALVASEAERQREWVGKLLAHLRTNANQLALQAKISPSTLSKFLAGSRADHLLNSHTIAKLGRAAGYAFPDAPELGAPRSLAESDALPYRPDDSVQDDAFVASLSVLCRGHNGRDPWIMSSSALAEIGILPGDIMVVDLNETAREGDIVCVQSYSGGSVATVFRVYRHPFLIGAGPGARLPLLSDGRSAQIRGVVIGTYRRRGVPESVA